MKTYFVIDGKFMNELGWDELRTVWLPKVEHPTLICYDSASYLYFLKYGFQAQLLNLSSTTSVADLLEHSSIPLNLETLTYKGFNLYELTEYDRWMSYHWVSKETILDVYLRAAQLIDTWETFFEKVTGEFCFYLYNPYVLHRHVPELMAYKYGKKVYYMNSYFNRVYLDEVGFGVRSSLCYIWHTLKNFTLSPLQTSQLKAFIADFHSKRYSKAYGKTIVDVPDKQQLYQTLSIPLEKKYVLLLEQFPYDANKIIHNPLIKTKEEFIRPAVLATEQHDYYLVVKRHPEDDVSLDSDFTKYFGEKCRLVNSVNIHDLLSHATVVITLNSTVGLEALTYYKPVITVASSVYAGKGFTFDVRTLAEYPIVLHEVLTNPVLSEKQVQAINTFLYYLIYGSVTRGQK